MLESCLVDGRPRLRKVFQSEFAMLASICNLNLNANLLSYPRYAMHI